MTIPTIGCLLLGGVVTDRFDRRRVMLAADAVRAVAIGTARGAVATGALELWHMLSLAAVYGGAPRSSTPAFDAIVPAAAAGDGAAAGQLARPVRAADRAPAGRAGARRRGCRDARRRRGVRARRRRRSSRPRSRCWRFARRGSHRGRGGAARFARHPRRGSGSSAGTRGSGARVVAPRSPTCCSSARPRCCCRSSSRTSCTGLPRSSAWCSPPAASARSAARDRRGPARPPAPRASPSSTAPGRWRRSPSPATGSPTRCGRLMLACLVFNALETAGTIVWATLKQRHVPAAMLGPRLEPRLADLDRPAAGLIRADGTGRRGDRDPRDARGRGPARRSGDGGRAARPGGDRGGRSGG